MLPENLAWFLNTQKNNGFRGVMASETRKERGWAESTSRLRLHALISRRGDIHPRNIFGSPEG